MPRKLSGGCACGAIRYECDADPVHYDELSLSRLSKSERQRLCSNCCSTESCRSDLRSAALPQSCWSERQND